MVGNTVLMMCVRHDLFLVRVVREPETCYNGQVRAVNTVTGSLNNGSSFNIAQYEACVNGTYLPVCSQNIQGETPLVFCRASNGYTDSM